jgi:hypothetical protein
MVVAEHVSVLGPWGGELPRVPHKCNASHRICAKYVKPGIACRECLFSAPEAEKGRQLGRLIHKNDTVSHACSSRKAIPPHKTSWESYERLAPEIFREIGNDQLHMADWKYHLLLGPHLIPSSLCSMLKLLSWIKNVTEVLLNGNACLFS